MEALALIFLFLILIVAVYIYFLPSLLANKNKREDANLILLVNLVMGWTLIGWGICLFWAISIQPNKVEEKK